MNEKGKVKQKMRPKENGVEITVIAASVGFEKDPSLSLQSTDNQPIVCAKQRTG